MQVFLTPTHLCIVMEYAAGGELFDRIVKAGRFSEDEARYFFQQLICGVDYCHQSVRCHPTCTAQAYEWSKQPQQLEADRSQDCQVAATCRTTFQPLTWHVVPALQHNWHSPVSWHAHTSCKCHIARITDSLPLLQGVCHRDLKLENTLLDGSPAPRVKICDFGYSKSALDSQPKSTVGTPAYIAPEVLQVCWCMSPQVLLQLSFWL